MSEYYMIITDAGAAMEAAAHASGTPVTLTEFAAGDGGGAPVTPDPTRTALVNEVYRGNISSLTINADDNTILNAQCVIPADSGGYTVREIGIYADDGTLYAIGNYIEQVKPDPSVGMAITMDVSVQLAVSDTSDITLYLNPGDYLTREEADALYLSRTKNLSEIKDNGEAAQAAARENIGAMPATYTAPVTSVNTKTGDVVLSAADVGALPDTWSPDLSGYYTRAEADARFLQGVRLGVRTTIEHISDMIQTPAGNVVTSLAGDSDNDIAGTYAPIEINLNGVWSVVPDTSGVSNGLLPHQLLREQLLQKASMAAFVLQSSQRAGHPRSGDDGKLLALDQFVDQLRDVDVNAEEPEWPEVPSFLS